MNRSSAESASCQVVGGEKLPAGSGGAEALCAAIEQAGGPAFRVKVEVLSPSSLNAVVTLADGRILPGQRFDVSDRELSKSSFQRFAENLVAVAAGGNRQ